MLNMIHEYDICDKIYELDCSHLESRIFDHRVANLYNRLLCKYLFLMQITLLLRYFQNTPCFTEI